MTRRLLTANLRYTGEYGIAKPVKGISPVIIRNHVFSGRDMIAGDPALDFINTVGGRDQIPRDRLDEFARLLEWASLAQLLPKPALAKIATQAQKKPREAARALLRAKRLREELFVVVTETIAGRVPPEKSVANVSAHWQAAVRAHELQFRDGNLSVCLRDQAIDLDLIADLMALRIVENVLPGPRERLRICAGADCAWLFIDRSKAGMRRWCDMAVCGNRAKFHNLRERARQQ